jgi:hypothetical protein
LASWRFNNEEPTAKNAKDAKQSEKATNQTANPLASSFVKATTPNRKFSCLFVWFVVKKVPAP